MTHAPRFGLGFRTQHFAELSANPRGVDWLELLSDNYLGVGGPRRALLERLRADFPIALHGVSLGIANDAPPRADYLTALRELADFALPAFVSDHLCWTGLAGRNSHDLLPVAATREVLAIVSERVARVQDALGRRILLENASAYVKFRADEMTEAELLAALCERTGCGVLLDINNLFVNAMNLSADPHAALLALAPHHVGYMHIAGHAVLPDVRIDTHGAPVSDGVWSLFESAARRFPNAGVMLERDDAIPSLQGLVEELDAARAHWQSAQRAEPLAQSAAQRRSQGTAAARFAREPWLETQRAFWANIAPHDASAGEAPRPCALDARLPVLPQRGLRIYRDALASMPERALATNFSTLARVLSRRDFAALCAALIRAHPSTSHDYSRLGAPLAEFIPTFAFKDAYGIAPDAFADIARLEQAQLEAQDAPDATTRISPPDLAALGTEQWEDARFSFAPALRIVFAAYDVLGALRAAAAGLAPTRPERAPTAYLVARRESVVRTERVDLPAARVLALLASGESFASACTSVGAADVAFAAAQALVLACALGGVSAISKTRSASAEPDAQSELAMDRAPLSARA